MRAAEPSLADFAQPALRDLSAAITIESKDNRELGKLGKGYADAYSLTDQEIHFKEPSLARFEGKRGLLTVRRITNARRQLFEVPALRIRKVEDISGKPGKADTIADLGILTPGWLATVEHSYSGSESREGRSLQRFTFAYLADRAARHVVLMDEATRTIAEHIHYHRDRKRPGYRKRLVYSDVRMTAGIWIPMRATLYSSDNRPAATMRYSRIRVNTGLPESLFRI